MQSNYVRVAATSEIPIGKMKMVTLQEKEILIVNIDGNYYAMGARCTHKNGNLSQGSFQDGVVTCPNHGAKFDIKTGKVVSPPKMGLFHPKIQDEPIYLVKVENGNIFIRL